MTKQAYLSIAVGNKQIGDLELELYDETVPKTVANFVYHLEENFKSTKFHRIIKGFMAQAGDYVHGNGTGGASLYGPQFDDENFKLQHTARGVLSMANSGPNTNGSQFFITFKPTPHLDQKHVVFGQVVGGDAVLQHMEQVSTGRNDVPRQPITIVECGLRQEPEKQAAAVVDEKKLIPTNAAQQDDNEIDLDDEEEDHDPVEEEEEEAQEESGTKRSLKDRLRRLKMKMNQARQLNRREVLREGERLGTQEGKTKERQRLAKQDKKQRQAEWEARNSKAIEMAKELGAADAKKLVEPAHNSLQRQEKHEARVEYHRYSAKDYYNPEGQYRHYERNLKSVPRNINREETGTYDPISAATNNATNDEAAGARRLANEMKRRIEKTKQKRARMEFESEDVTSINKRNKLFNKKISRAYDKDTAEIRQNLERGTAL